MTMTNNETTTTATPTTAPAPTKAELRAVELKVAREKREADKAATKAANAEKRANGVIGTLHQMLQVPTGCTKKEVLAALTTKFADRDPIGMATTVGIQLSRLQKKHGRIVSRKVADRGLVYGYERTVQFPAEGSEGTTAPTPAPVKTPAPTTTTEIVHANGETEMVLPKQSGKKHRR